MQWGFAKLLKNPEPPQTPPKQVGLPYEPSSCGCSETKELTSNSNGLSTLGAGIKNLGDCVDKFTSTALTDYQSALQDKCPDLVTTGMEILQSVEKITVDSIKTHY